MLNRLKERKYADQIALTPALASRIDHLSSDLIIGDLPEILERTWEAGSMLIFVGATGAVVRLIAPLIQGKDYDPAVVVIDANA